MTRKRKGEIAEAEFLAIALRLGFIVSKPWGDSAPHDFLLQSASGRLYRIQVKSCWTKNQHAYVINAGRLGNRIAYRSCDVDFIAACIDLGPLRCPHCHKSLVRRIGGRGTASSRAVKNRSASRALAPEVFGRRPTTADRRVRDGELQSERCRARAEQGAKQRSVAAPRNKAWYLIPLRALRGQKIIALFPHTPNSRSRFEPFRESWRLLA